MLERKISLLIGKCGTGKTYLTKLLCSQEPRLIVIDQRNEYTQLFPAFYDFAQLCYFCKTRNKFQVAWCGGLDFSNHIFHLAFALSSCAIVVEEADLIPCEGWYHEVIYRGRMPYKISLYGLSQRPHLFSPDLRSQATDVYAFNNSEPSAILWLKTFFPKSENLTRLPYKSCLHYSVESNTITQIILP